MTNTDKIFEMLNLKPEQKFTIKDSSTIYIMSENLYIYIVGDLEDEKIVDYKRTPSELMNLSYLIKHSDDIIIIPEKKQYTREQKVIAEALVLQGFNWLAKDKNGRIYAYSTKPKKSFLYDNWMSGNDKYDWKSVEFDFPQITWEDDEPVWLKDIIDSTEQNNKEKFNIENYPSGYVMHCDTEEKAKIFCKYLDSIGKSWCNGDRYLQDTMWSVHRDKTCYNFNSNAFESVNWYKENDYTILEFDDFDWNNFEYREGVNL